MERKPFNEDPTCLLDLNWNDDDENIFLEMFKKFFKTSKTRSQYFDNPSASDPTFNKITKWVQVPTSEHVAQILGKKGRKIRALREITNTYIRSPLPNEEPIFIVKGKSEDVAEAVKSIKSTSEYFTNLENEKKMLKSTAIASSKGKIIVVKFSIPERYVGLVVGVKGATIKEIEKQSKTFILSPIMDSESVFTITGSSEHCEKAMNLISRYLALRGVEAGTVVDLEQDNSSFDYFFAWVH